MIKAISINLTALIFTLLYSNTAISEVKIFGIAPSMTDREIMRVAQTRGLNCQPAWEWGEALFGPKDPLTGEKLPYKPSWDKIDCLDRNNIVNIYIREDTIMFGCEISNTCSTQRTIADVIQALEKKYRELQFKKEGDTWYCAKKGSGQVYKICVEQHSILFSNRRNIRIYIERSRNLNALNF